MKSIDTTYLRSGPTILEIESELPIFNSLDERLITSAFVPGATFSIDEKGPLAQRVYIEKSKVPRVEKHNEGILVSDDWSNQMPMYLVHLLYSIIKNENLTQGKYSLHSSCVTKGDEGFLFIGHSGSGKTISALEMVRNYNFGWYSGNKTLVEFEDNERSRKATSELVAIEGTLPVTLEADNDYDNPVLDETVEIPFVDRKLRLLGKEYLIDLPSIAIRGIILVRVNSGARKLNHLSPAGAAINLFPFFYDYFNTDIHLPNGRVFNPGFADDSHRDHLEGQLTKSLEGIPTYQVSGSFDYISQTVEDIYNG